MTNNDAAGAAAVGKESFLQLPLSIDPGSAETGANNNNNHCRHDDDEEDSSDDRILQIIRQSPNYTIRPDRLAAKLNGIISVNNACAALCELLAAVGADEQGAFFFVEETKTPPAVRIEQDTSSATATINSVSSSRRQQPEDVMVFVFPPDFAQRVLRSRRQQDVWTVVHQCLAMAFRLVKVVTAFGLILLLLFWMILSVAVVVALLTVMVATMSRENGINNSTATSSRGHRTSMRQKIRSLFVTIRQMLWCYAVFGPNDDTDGQHPFFREIAHDALLLLSCCCGNPGSIFCWLRASQLARRRHRIARGWRRGSGTNGDGAKSAVVDDILEGGSLIRKGSWGEETEKARNSTMAPVPDDGRRGLFSVFVEFLFGPSFLCTRSKDDDVWKLRGTFIVEESTKSGGVSLEALSPYLGFPPSLNDGASSIVEQALMIVAHFNGMPKSISSQNDMLKATFVFPELMAESEVYLQYVDIDGDDDDGTWESFLYTKCANTRSIATMSPMLENFYAEKRYRFTKLTWKQLCTAVSLGVLNLLGVIWLRQSIGKGGFLELQQQSSSLAIFLNGLLLPVLRGYGILFLALPATRIVVLVVLNHRLGKRNQRRQRLAKVMASRH